jgi:metal-responsive CopG/Arc/MetJ family transcriptional regulator
MREQRKHRRGRPATGKDPFVGIRLAPYLIEAVDVWAKAQGGLSRSAAVRMLLERALGPKK